MLHYIRDKKKPGEKLKFSIIRDGEVLDVDVKLMDSADFKQ